MTDASADTDLIHCLHAANVPGVTTQRYDAMIERFGSWPDALAASARDLAAVPGVGEGAARKIKAGAADVDVDADLARTAELGGHVIHRGSDVYPEGLKRLPDAPLALYVRGEIRVSDALALAIVGARRCTFYGRTQAERLAAGLARAGFTIVSGKALGIDACAHWGAVRAGGRTIAVLGCGLAVEYPLDTRELTEAIIENGAILSEFPLDAAPTADHFPRRNRLIAALSLGVIVAEAAQRSGALITARLAAEMGKDVFAVPGNVSQPESRGCHRLIREGAKLVETVDDVIIELGPLAEVIEMPNGTSVADPRAFSLNKAEAAVFGLVSATPRSIDELIEESGMPASQVASTLMVLELKKLVQPLAGKRFVRM